MKIKSQIFVFFVGFLLLFTFAQNSIPLAGASDSPRYWALIIAGSTDCASLTVLD